MDKSHWMWRNTNEAMNKVIEGKMEAPSPAGRPPMRSEPRMSDERLAEIRKRLQRETVTVTAAHLWAGELLAEVEALRADAVRLRKNWWLSHGYAVHRSIAPLYGDDGEMQCNACMIDFKRTPVEEIELRLYELGMARAASLLSALPVVEDAADHRGEDRTATAESGVDQEGSTASTTDQGTPLPR